LIYEEDATTAMWRNAEAHHLHPGSATTQKLLERLRSRIKALEEQLAQRAGPPAKPTSDLFDQVVELLRAQPAAPAPRTKKRTAMADT